MRARALPTRLLIVDDDPATELALAALRRAGGIVLDSGGSLSAGGVTLRLDTREVTARGGRVTVTSYQCAVLELLLLRAGRLVSREALHDRLYGGGDGPESKVLPVLVNKLRGKLAAIGAPGLVETVRGEGFIVREPAAADAA